MLGRFVNSSRGLRIIPSVLFHCLRPCADIASSRYCTDNSDYFYGDGLSYPPVLYYSEPRFSVQSLSSVLGGIKNFKLAVV